MSEGRTPTATITEQRRLEQSDVDILHQIVIRAQNDPVSQDRPKDALLQAYGEIFDERRLNKHQDRACFNVLLKLLDPATPGESLYHKFELILQQEGIELAYDDDDAATQDAPANYSDRRSDGTGHEADPLASPLRQSTRNGYYPTESVVQDGLAQSMHEEAYLEDTPAYVTTLLHQAERRDRTVLAKQTLDAWRSALGAVRERQLEARADALYELRLKRKVLKQCLAVFEDLHHSQHQADNIYRSKLVRSALGKTSDEYRVRRVSSIDDDRVKGLSLYKWTLASRESILTRKMELQLKHSVLAKLVETYRISRAKEAQLEHILQQSKLQNHRSLLSAAVQLLAQKSTAVHADQSLADSHNQNTLCYASINAWRLRMGKMADLNLTAEDAREYFLMKRTVRQLRAITLFRRDRRIWLATWTSRKWQDFVKDRKHARYDEAYRQMRRTIKINVARRLLLHWQQKARAQHDDDLKADEFYQSSVLRRIAKPVIEHIFDTAQAAQHNARTADVKADAFLQQRALIAMQSKHQTILDMFDRARSLHQIRVEQRAVQVCRQIQLKAFELRCRQSDADAFRDRHVRRQVRYQLAKMRRILAERRAGNDLALVPAPAITPARKRQELFSSTRLSTTPAYTPFTTRLKQGPRVLEDIDDEEEMSQDLQDEHFDGNSDQ